MTKPGGCSKLARGHARFRLPCGARSTIATGAVAFRAAACVSPRVITSDTGRPLPDVPRSPWVPADPIGAFRAHHEAQGLRLHARTACAGWLGERLNVEWAIDVLHPLATTPKALICQ